MASFKRCCWAVVSEASRSRCRREYADFALRISRFVLVSFTTLLRMAFISDARALNASASLLLSASDGFAFAIFSANAS